jgi:hypothetical protein
MGTYRYPDFVKRNLDGFQASQTGCPEGSCARTALRLHVHQIWMVALQLHGHHVSSLLDRSIDQSVWAGSVLTTLHVLM